MSHRTRVKICGITRLQDALYAVESGADSIGLNFHRSSPRFIDIEQALMIRRQIPPFINVTALLMNENDDWVAQVVHQVRPDSLQFHGSESVDTCEIWQLPYLKVIPMGSVADPVKYAQEYGSAQGFLFDSNAAGRQGGSGDTFDWSKIPSSFNFPMVLAGGINASNVAEAIVQVNPWGVDVSSGVETSKGIKSADLIDQFILEVNRGDDRKTGA